MNQLTGAILAGGRSGSKWRANDLVAGFELRRPVFKLNDPSGIQMVEQAERNGWSHDTGYIGQSVPAPVGGRGHLHRLPALTAP